MSKWAMIATWRMSYEGVIEAKKLLDRNQSSADAIDLAITMVEDYPFYKSVGFGGLPNEDGEVELDAAFMDGDTLSFGAIAGVKSIKNPIKVARRLKDERFNCVLVGAGAERFATLNGFAMKNMLSDRAYLHYQKRLKEMASGLSAYNGHDTVGMVCLDRNRSMTVGTSTSGLFMKKAGRVGDSPIIGSGFYVDSEYGGASCTGVGEDLMKGCLSYEAVRMLKEGISVQDIAQPLIDQFVGKLEKRRGKAGAMSLIVMDKDGNWAVGTNVQFSFVVAKEGEETTIYVAEPLDDRSVKIEVATPEFLEAYKKRISSPIEI